MTTPRAPHLADHPEDDASPGRRRLRAGRLLLVTLALAALVIGGLAWNSHRSAPPPGPDSKTFPLGQHDQPGGREDPTGVLSATPEPSPTEPGLTPPTADPRKRTMMRASGTGGSGGGPVLELSGVGAFEVVISVVCRDGGVVRVVADQDDETVLTFRARCDGRRQDRTVRSGGPLTVGVSADKRQQWALLVQISARSR